MPKIKPLSVVAKYVNILPPKRINVWIAIIGVILKGENERFMGSLFSRVSSVYY